MRHSVLLQLPTMTFNKFEYNKKNIVTFLRIIMDESLTWENYIKVIKNRISKKIGARYRDNHLLDFKNDLCY